MGVGVIITSPTRTTGVISPVVIMEDTEAAEVMGTILIIETIRRPEMDLRPRVGGIMGVGVVEVTIMVEGDTTPRPDRMDREDSDGVGVIQRRIIIMRMEAGVVGQEVIVTIPTSLLIIKVSGNL